jgi:hypothetical protein
VAILRVNNVGDPTGTVNPITLTTSGAVTATWASAPANMPTVASPNILKVVVEPNTAAEEIIYVTAYTAGATSATVTRAQEGSPGNLHTAKPWAHGPTAADFPPFTSSGDLLVGGANGALTRLANTTSGFARYLSSFSGGSPNWSSLGFTNTQSFIGTDVGINAATDFNINSINLTGLTGVWLLMAQVLAYDSTAANTLDLYVSPASGSTGSGYLGAAELGLVQGVPNSTAFFVLVTAGSIFYLNGRGAASHGLVKASTVLTGLFNVTGMVAVQPG